MQCGALLTHLPLLLMMMCAGLADPAGPPLQVAQAVVRHAHVSAVTDHWQPLHTCVKWYLCCVTKLGVVAVCRVFRVQLPTITCNIAISAIDSYVSARRYGAEKLQGMVRHHIALGQWFAQQVEADGRFEIPVPPRFGLTCFRLKGADNATNRQLMEAVNARGESLNGLAVRAWCVTACCCYAAADVGTA